MSRNKHLVKSREHTQRLARFLNLSIRPPRRRKRGNAIPRRLRGLVRS